MLIFILIATAVIIGGSVMVGMALNSANQRERSRRNPREPGAPLSREEKMNMLKASGALKHRKSNR